jgi:hypothetical protein
VIWLVQSTSGVQEYGFRPMLGEVPSFSLPSTLPNLPMVADISWNGKFTASGLLILKLYVRVFRWLLKKGRCLSEWYSRDNIIDTLCCMTGSSRQSHSIPLIAPSVGHYRTTSFGDSSAEGTPTKSDTRSLDSELFRHYWSPIYALGYC